MEKGQNPFSHLAEQGGVLLCYSGNKREGNIEIRRVNAIPTRTLFVRDAE